MPTLEPTMSIGKLFIDERNGYIGLCPTARYNPKKCKWYSMLEVQNPGLYCTNPKCDYKYRVLVDCEFICDIPAEGIQIKKIVKSRIYCQHHPYTKDKNYEEWSEPGSISIARGAIIQAYANAVNRELAKWENQLYCLRGAIAEQARCAFLLPRGYTAQDIEQRYETLTQAFSENPRCLSLIQRYYKSLKE